jgi:hypothetical protein
MSKSLFAVALAAMTLVPLTGAFAQPYNSAPTQGEPTPAKKEKKSSNAMKTKPAAATTTEDSSKNKSTEDSYMKNEPSSAPSDSLPNPTNGGSMSKPASPGTPK